ncbi:MAG: YceI family protein [Pseudomonadota bacterium]
MKQALPLLLLSALLGAGAACAAPQTYAVDSRHTYPRFEISHFGFSMHSGIFTQSSGTIVLDTAEKTGQVDIAVQTASIDTGAEDLEKVLRSPAFFDAGKYPQMRFQSQAFQFDGDKLATVQGQLTLLGVTQPLVLTVVRFHCGAHPVSKKEECGANLAGTIKRSDFGMKTFLPGVGDEVRLIVQVEAIKE